jgi:hypothetical protein
MYPLIQTAFRPNTLAFCFIPHIQNFKFKLKLTPGTLKKGKIAKQALDAFGAMRDASPAERRALSALSLPEVVASLIGDAKISMPGLQTVQRQAKKKSKGKK